MFHYYSKCLLLIVFCHFGISQYAIKNRIIGGENIDITEAPWHVLIIGTSISGKSVGQSTCGGTIISKKTILTMYSCVAEYKHDPYEYRMFAGKNTPHEHDYIKVDRVERDRDGIAMAILSVDLLFGPTLNVATVSGRFMFHQGIFLRLNGYPCDENGIECGLNLQKVDVPILSWNDCVNLFGAINIGPNNFCTGTEIASDGSLKSSCVGDIGSGLMNYNTQSEYWELVGIVVSTSCGVTPTKNLNIIPFYEWIRNNLE